MTSRTFSTTIAAAGRGRGVLVPVPFDPDTVWGTKPRHHVTGTVNGMGVRGVGLRHLPAQRAACRGNGAPKGRTLVEARNASGGSPAPRAWPAIGPSSLHDAEAQVRDTGALDHPGALQLDRLHALVEQPDAVPEQDRHQI